MGVLGWHPPVRLLTPAVLSPLASRGGSDNPLRFLKLPTRARPGGHAVSHWPITWLPSLFLYWPGGCYSTRRPY